MRKNELSVLVVYYSLAGSTRLIAESIAEETNSSILELIPQKDIKPNGSMKYLMGGTQVATKWKPALLSYSVKPEEFELLFIGTPVWAWSFAPAIRTFFLKNHIQGKKIALFSCNEGDNGKTFEHMKEMLKGNEFLGEIEFYDPLRNNKEENIKRAKTWARETISKIE